MVNILHIETDEGLLVPVNAGELPAGTSLRPNTDGSFRIDSSANQAKVDAVIGAAVEATRLHCPVLPS